MTSFTDTEMQEIAIESIYNYYNGKYNREYISSNFQLAIKLFIENSKQLLNREVNVVSETQGSRTKTYADINSVYSFKLTPDILALLPRKANLYAW